MKATPVTRLTTQLGDQGVPERAQGRAFVPLLRFAPLILAVTLVGAVLGFAVSSLRSVSYEASGQVYPVDPQTGTASGVGLPAPSGVGLVSATLTTVTSDEVLGAAARSLRTTAADLRGRVRASASQATGSVEIVVSSGSPARAAAGLRAVLTALTHAVSQQRSAYLATATRTLTSYANSLQQQLGRAGQPAAVRLAIQTRLDAVDARLQDLAIEKALVGQPFYFPKAVEAPRSPAGPGRKVEVLAGAILALVAGAIYAWRKVEQSPRLLDRHDLAAVVSAPVLAELVPQTHRRQRADETASPEAPVLLDTVIHGDVERPADHEDVIVVTGVGPDDAIGRVALGLAADASTTRRRVRVVGATRDDLTQQQAQADAQGRTRGSRLSVDQDGIACFSQLERRGAWEMPDLVIVCEPPTTLDRRRTESELLTGAPTILVVHRDCLKADVRRTVAALLLSGRSLVGCVFATTPPVHRQAETAGPARLAPTGAASRVG